MPDRDGAQCSAELRCACRPLAPAPGLVVALAFGIALPRWLGAGGVVGCRGGEDAAQSQGGGEGEDAWAAVRLQSNV